MALPNTGDLNWGVPLNAEITLDETNISTNTTNLSNHAGNVPADPHGDRAYASSLVNGITSTVNQPGGYVTLGSNGKLQLSQVPTGAGLTNWVDAVANYMTAGMTNGTADASVALNSAIASISATGGIVYVGSGTFNLATPIVMFSNTWLLCSPGAVFKRVQTSQVTAAMVQNYLPTNAPSGGLVPNGGNIRITGGTWNVANLGATGRAFSFADNQAGNVNGILIEDLQVVGYNDGRSPVASFYGVNNVVIDNVQITAGNSSSGGTFPLIQIEELNATNLPGVPNSMYSSASPRCSNHVIRGCSATVGSPATTSPWSSFVGSVGIIASSGVHSNINIVEGNFCNILAVSGVQALNYSNLTCTGNQFTFPQFPYQASWNPGGLSSTYISSFVFDINSPRVYPPSTLATCNSNGVETIISQFTVPANDWIPSTTCYRHRHTGQITTTHNTGTLTINVYVGIHGTTADTLVETITFTTTNNVASQPYACHHRGFDIDSNGFWNPGGLEFISACITNNVSISINSTRFQPTAGVVLFVTHTAKWNTAGNSIQCLSGVHERVSV